MVGHDVPKRAVTIGRNTQLAFMSPLFGVLMGYLWLGEQTSFGFLLGASLTIVGLLVVNLSKAVEQTGDERSYPTPPNREEKMHL